MTAEDPTDSLAQARRILVIGCGGAGKSSLAKRLGEILGVGVVHLDRLYWGPGWTEPLPHEWEATVRRAVEAESWVMDGNYGGTLDLRLAAADAVIFLDVPRLTCLRRVMARRLRHHGRSRPDVAPGCPERLDVGFLKYIWRYPRNRRPGILRKLEEHSQRTRVHVLRSPEEVEALVASLRRARDTEAGREADRRKPGREPLESSP